MNLIQSLALAAYIILSVLFFAVIREQFIKSWLKSSPKSQRKKIYTLLRVASLNLILAGILSTVELIKILVSISH